jgi:plasmid stabilization system protein ParE
VKVIWLHQAQGDIQRLFDFLLERDPVAAERAVRAIQTGARRLADHPQIGRPMSDDSGRRELLVPFGAGAHVIRYLSQRERVVVIRVWHSREERG